MRWSWGFRCRVAHVFLTLFQAEPEVDEGVEGERRDMRLSPPLGAGLPVLLVLDPPVEMVIVLAL